MKIYYIILIVSLFSIQTSFAQFDGLGGWLKDKTKNILCNEGPQDGPQGSGGAENTNGGSSFSGGIDIPVFAPQDPNEIIGPQGYDDSLRWVSTSTPLGYTIYFENDPDFATANAQRVEVRYAFDPKAEMYSFGLGSFGFGSFVFSVEDAPAIYQKRLDVRDSLGIYVDIVAGIDVNKKEAFWLFSSIDPATGLPPLEVDKGFLPVNDKEKHNGEGFVSFVMKAKSDSQSGDSIKADASIVFDINEAISTNVWQNRLDAVAPTSSFKAEVNKEKPGIYDFHFTATDDVKGSGVRQIAVYMSRNKEPYKQLAVCSPDSIWRFTAEGGAEYGFYTQAEDFAGNTEKLKEVAEYTINSNTAPTNIFLSDTTFQDDIEVDGFIGDLTAEDTEDNQQFLYQLVEGEGAVHNGRFRIDGTHLLAGTSFRCADETTYRVRIQTTDIGGLKYAKPFVLKMKQVLIHPVPDTLEVNICQGEVYDFYGKTCSETGMYTHRKENAYMCDSIYVLNLRVNPYPSKPLVTVNGALLTSSALNGNQWFNEDGAIEGATGQTFTPDKSGNYYVVVSNGGCESQPSETYFVNLTGEQEIGWNLHAGWNWLSVNIKEVSDPKKFLKPVEGQAERLISQTAELTKDPVYGMVGKLDKLSPETSYKLKMSGAELLKWSGEALSAGDVDIHVRKGWNWLGYVPAVELTPDVALANAQPLLGDEIKGQTAFATYDGSSWVGTLKAMVPGEGYMYHSMQDKTFTYSTARATSLRNMRMGQEIESHAWSFDPYKYPDNMSIIAFVYDEQTKAESGIYAVGAFVGDECRGEGVYVDGKLFITVHGGKKGENVSFKAIENATGKELSVAETVRFGEATVGSLVQPFALHLKSSSSVGMDDMQDMFLSVYPNPVRNQLNIGGDYHLVKNVIVLDMSGRPMIRQTLNGGNTLDVSSLHDGAYIVVLDTQKGMVYHKIIKLATVIK